ncbi:hypothetical protein [Caulobacter radicis]|uniref:hypothetical protein n=1 Tax=Caulobacter radicis TaxID=2172650 RepID=UPI001FCB203F|nr:hypothetical protein [Caulobacter radicis]
MVDPVHAGQGLGVEGRKLGLQVDEQLAGAGDPGRRAVVQPAARGGVGAGVHARQGHQLRRVEHRLADQALQHGGQALALGLAGQGGDGRGQGGGGRKERTAVDHGLGCTLRRVSRQG